MICIYFAAIAFLTMFIYRQGLKDGQRVASGEKVFDKPIKLVKTKAEKIQGKEQEKFIKAINDRLEYGVKR